MNYQFDCGLEQLVLVVGRTGGSCLKPLFCLTLVLIVFLSGRVATAAPHTHDGLFVGMHGGYSFVTDGLRVSGSQNGDGNLTAHGMTGDIQVGGTFQPSWGAAVLGGTLGYTFCPATRMTFNGIDAGTTQASDLFLGLFGRLYPDPTGGLNFSIFSGGHTLRFNQAQSAVASATGYVFGFGAGYDRWIGEDWALALNAQISGGSLSDDGSGVTRSHLLWTPLFTVGFVYH
jgi:hypothetical protein